MASSKKPVALIIGASRGLGRQIAIDFGAEGYAVVVSGKSVSKDSDDGAPFPPDPNSQSSTITTVCREMTELGQTAMAVPVDTRSPASIQSLVDTTVSTYGKIDVLVYNAGAIFWAPVSRTPLSRYALMQSVNADGLYASIQSSLPHLTPTARIIVVCPPIYSRFFRGKTAYAMGKIAMSVLVQGLAMDIDREPENQQTITGMWPATAIESAATRNVGSNRVQLRTAKIFSDAVVAVTKAEKKDVHGVLAVDEDFLREVAGLKDFDGYAVVPRSKPRRIMPKKFPSLRVEEQDDEGDRMDSTKPKAKL